MRSNSVTRQVNYKTFISWKVCGNPKNRTCGHPKNPRIQRKLCGLFHVANSSLNHSVWKSLKMSHSTLRATFTFWVDKSLLKMPKIVKFGGNCQNLKIQIRHFGWFSNTVGCERSPEFSFVAFYRMKTTSEFDFRGKRQNMYLGFLFVLFIIQEFFLTHLC